MSHTLLICNGRMPGLAHAAHVRRLAEEASFVLCADGGANAARMLGVVPHAVVGDFDSVTDETRRFFESGGVEFHHDAGQENTDFEKALLFLRERGMNRIAMLGLTGDLLDHTLGNFSILQRHARSIEAVIFDAEFRIDLMTRSAVFSSRPGERISIVPLVSATGVTFSGLAYPMKRGELAFGVMEGTCNRALSARFRVSLREGALLVFRPLRDDRWRL